MASGLSFSRDAISAPALEALALSALLSVGCAHSAARGTSPGEQVLSQGGELANTPAKRSLQVTASQVSVWGITEVPADSRWQVALAGVDAITRSELLAAIEVRVSEVVKSVDSSDPSRRSVVVQTSDAVAGVFARGAPLPHGWARIARGGQIILRIWARLDVPRDALETALRSTLSAHMDPSSLVDALTLTEEAPR
jgi:hypothetical protein